MENGSAIAKARETVGLTTYRTAQCIGISHQAVLNLEGGERATRQTDPGDCKLRTVHDLIVLFWPHIQLHDLIPDTPFKLTARTKRRGYELRRDVGKPLA